MNDLRRPEIARRTLLRKFGDKSSVKWLLLADAFQQRAAGKSDARVREAISVTAQQCRLLAAEKARQEAVAN